MLQSCEKPTGAAKLRKNILGESPWPRPMLGLTPFGGWIDPDPVLGLMSHYAQLEWCAGDRSGGSLVPGMKNCVWPHQTCRVGGRGFRVQSLYLCMFLSYLHQALPNPSTVLYFMNLAS